MPGPRAVIRALERAARLPGLVLELRDELARQDARIASLEYAATPAATPAKTAAPARTPLDVFAHATR